MAHMSFNIYLLIRKKSKKRFRPHTAKEWMIGRNKLDIVWLMRYWIICFWCLLDLTWLKWCHILSNNIGGHVKKKKHKQYQYKVHDSMTSSHVLHTNISQQTAKKLCVGRFRNRRGSLVFVLTQRVGQGCKNTHMIFFGECVEHGSCPDRNCPTSKSGTHQLPQSGFPINCLQLHV